MSHWTAQFIRRPVATSLLSLGLVLAGLLAWFLLPVAPLPQVEYPTISVSASLPGASAETMAATVATPLERALGSIAGVTEITSSSSLGNTRVSIQFDLDRDIHAAARNVQAAINASRAMLPSGLPGNPTYRLVNPSDTPILILALSSDTVAREQMFDLASTVLAQRLAQVQGVGDVAVGGASLPAVRVELDPTRLAANGLALDQVRMALVRQNNNRPKGLLEEQGRQWQIAANDQSRAASEFAPLIVSWRNGAAVRLRDVADVKDSVQDVRAHGLADGRPAVLIILYKAPGANIIDTADEVRALLPRLQALIPPSMTLGVTMDSTPAIRASLREVQLALAATVVLVIAVVYAFTRSARLSLVPCVAVPVSMAGTLCVMYLLGYSINNVSLMAMTVSTCFVVDDAIVVLDSIRRHLARGLRPLEAALASTREISFTLVSIGLALIAAFIPILFMGGIIGRVFREFAMVLSVATVVSLLVSLTATPMLAAVWLKPAGAAQAARRSNAGLLQRLARRAARGHRRLMRGLLRRPAAGLAALGLVVAGNVAIYRTIDKGFLPLQDTGRLVGGIDTDQAASFQMTRDKLERLVAIVQQDPAVAHVTAYIGGAQRGGPNVMVSLKPRPERNATAQQVVDRLRPRLSRIPGAQLYLRAGQDIRIGGRPSSAEYQYTLQADSLDELRHWEPVIRRALARLPELTDVNSDQRDGGLQTSLVIDRDAASRLGLSMRDIDETLNNAFGQRQVGVIFNTLNQYRVVMQLAAPFQQGAEALRHLYLTSATGQQVPLSAVARVEETLAPLYVSHERGTVATTISFNVPPGGSLSQATDAVNNAVAELGVPVSLRGTFSGTANAFREALATQPMLILAAVVAIYLVLGMLYESLVHPVTILSTLPSAGLGALLALLASRTEFSMIALLGLVLLIGIVMKNAIMMIDAAIALQARAAAQGSELSAAAAIYRAARLRLRPILMTTLAALLGAVPLAVGHGDGAELRQPLGIAVVGGLAVSQLLSLYITPAVFVGMDRLRHRRRAHRPGPVAARPAPA